MITRTSVFLRFTTQINIKMHKCERDSMLDRWQEWYINQTYSQMNAKTDGIASTIHRYISWSDDARLLLRDGSSIGWSSIISCCGLPIVCCICEWIVWIRTRLLCHGGLLLAHILSLIVARVLIVASHSGSASHPLLVNICRELAQICPWLVS